MNTTKLPRVARRAFGVALASALMMIPCTTGIAAETSVPLDAAHFPDPAFREWVEQYDRNDDGVFSQQEIDDVTDINGSCYTENNAPVCQVASLQGIEYFTSLEYLGMYGNQLKSVDLSKNTALTELNLGNNQLTSIDLRHNTRLNDIDLSYNQFSSIDLSANTALTKLDLSNNKLASIDVRNNAALTNLNLFANKLASIDVSHNTALTGLSVSDNQLISADVEHNTALTSLSLDDNQLSAIDVSHNPNLAYLSLEDNKLTSVDVSHNPALTELHLGGNQLPSIDVSHNTQLTELSAGGNQLSQVDMSSHTALTTLDLNSNELRSVDLSHNTALTKLDLTDNMLESLDLSHNTALTEVEIQGNVLGTLDVSHNTALERLWVNDNQLTSLDVSRNTALTDLLVEDNYLPSLDVSHNTALTNLSVSNNELLWLSDVTPSAKDYFDAESQLFWASDPTLDLAKAAPGIDVSRISNVQGGRLQGSVLSPTNADGRVTYDYRFSDAYEPLHAQVQFESTVYTVAFDTNGGSGNTVISVVSGETVSAPDAPTREGYTFDGWYTAKDGGTKYDFSKPVTGDLTLYAHWTAKTTPVKITFRDVSSSTPHHEDIQWLADNGISTGWKMADGRYEFRGMSAVVRQDMAAFLRREAVKRGIGDAKTWKPTNADWNTFKDVNRGTPHAEDILWLAHAGISTGWKEKDGSSTFRGMSPVVRQDMAAFLRRLAKLGKKDGGVTPKYDFRDVKFTDPGKTPHADDIAWLAGSGISEGWKVGNAREFRGMSPVVRQDMAAFLHRLDNQLAK